MTTYSKLKDGSWGLRGPGLLPGMVVTVTLKNGETKQETVDHVLWTGEDGMTLASRVEDSKAIGKVKPSAAGTADAEAAGVKAAKGKAKAGDQALTEGEKVAIKIAIAALTRLVE